MIIDAHCHVGVGDGLTGPWDTRASLGRYLQRAQQAGVHRTVVFSVFHSDYGVANEALARRVARAPDRLIGFAFVHAERDRGRVRKMIAVSVERWGFRGIKVHRHDAPLSREICVAAREHNVPILYDPMGDLRAISLLASEYEDVAFIIPHLGSFADDYWVQRAVIDLMARLDNVYADTAGVRRFDVLVEAVDRIGAHRLIFGSDGPFLHPGVELHKVKLLNLEANDESLVLGGNIARLIGVRCHSRLLTSRNTRHRGSPGGPLLQRRTVNHGS